MRPEVGCYEYLPPVGSAAPSGDAKGKGKGKAAETKPAKPAAAETEERGPRFDKLDKDKHGKRTPEGVRRSTHV